MDEAEIEAQVQKELDAISLSSFESDEESNEENITLVYNDDNETVGAGTMQLFLEKSSERNKLAQDILKDAEDLLTMFNSVEQTAPEESSQSVFEVSNTAIEYHDTTVMLSPDSKREAIAKTSSEIEDENRIKLEELDNRLQKEEEEHNVKLEEKRISDEENLHQWKKREEKMQKNITVMLDKANYWERTYDQLAHEEFATKEQDLEKEFLESQERIELIQEEQKRILQDLLKEKEELDRKRNDNSAICIQKMFRGYAVRKQHGQELKERILRSKEKRKQERIANIEKRQAEMRAAKQKEKEENEKKALLEKEKEENEKKASLEKEKKPLLEKEKEENEKKTIQKEREENEKKALLEKEKEESKKKALLDKENRENSVAILAVNSQDQPSNKSTSNVTNKDEEDTCYKMLDKCHSETGRPTSNDSTTQVTHQKDSFENHTKDNDTSSFKMDKISNDLSQTKNGDQSTIVQSANDLKKESVSVAVVSKLNIVKSPENHIRANETMPKLKNDVENINEKTGEDHIDIFKSRKIANGVNDHESKIKTEPGFSVKNDSSSTEFDKPIRLSVAKNIATRLTDEDWIALKDSEPAHTEKHNDSQSLQVCLKSTSSATLEIVTSKSIGENQGFSDDKCDVKELIAFDASGVDFSKPDSESQNLLKTQRASLNRNGVTERSNFEPIEDSFTKISAEEISTNSVSEPDGQHAINRRFTTENDKYPENQIQDAETITVVLTKSVANVFEDDNTKSGNVSVSGSEKLQFIISNTSVIAVEKGGSQAAGEQGTANAINTIANFATEEIIHNETLESNVFETNAIQGAFKSTQNDADRDIRQLASLTDGNDTSLTEDSAPSHSISVSSIDSDKHFLEQTSYQSNHKSSASSSGGNHSYSDAIKTQRLCWLERMKSKDRKEWEALSVSKRRRLIRISSAAKRLSPFSENEILDGCYLSTDCRVDRKVSDIEKAKCIVLRDIEGGRNLLSLSRCSYLSYLTIRNCGLVSLESLQSCPCLKYIDVSHNAVNMISCSGMKRLEVLDISYNRLTSMHGMDGCVELLFLDLSHNNITKIAGLEDAKKLLHIRLKNNQIINASGIHCCENLLYLDVSENHLVNLEDFENLNLLLSLSASGNNLEKLGADFLENTVLLTKLDVSRNSLRSLGIAEDSFLPLFTEFNASINRISSPSENMDFSLISPFLCDMNLSKNMLQSTKNLRSVASCQCLHKVDLTDNPLVIDSGADEDGKFLRMLPEVVTKHDKNAENLIENSALKVVFDIFCPLRNVEKTFVNLTDQSEEENILNVVSKQLEKLQSEVKRHSTDVQRAMIRWKGRTRISSDYSNAIHPPQLLIDHASHLKRLFDLALFFRNVHESANMTYSPISNEQNQTKSPEEFEDNSIDDTFMAKDVRQRILVTREEPQPFENSVHKVGKSTVRASTVYDQLLKRNISDSEKETAATHIQAFWNGCRVRKKHQKIKNHKISAAIKIQAAWKGYYTRRKIGDAMKLLKQAEPETSKQEDFEDIDLDGFDFDEKSFDEQWAYKVSGFDKLYLPSEEVASYEVPVFKSQKTENVIKTPVDCQHMGMAYSKPPLPPIPSRTSTPLDTRLTLSELNSREPSIADSAQTKRSIKQEVLSNEWGIKSSSTADLMMRRARRMKGGRKKIQTADEKLQRFQEKTSGFQNYELSVNRKHENPNKVEYFKAREQDYSLKNKITAEEDEQKQKYTYEWLHSQVGSHYDPHHIKTSPPRNVGNSQTTRTRPSGFLPAIPRSPSLVGVQDLEVVSVSSSSSYMNRSKQRLRDIARRHNPSYSGQSR